MAYKCCFIATALTCLEVVIILVIFFILDRSPGRLSDPLPCYMQHGSKLVSFLWFRTLRLCRSDSGSGIRPSTMILYIFIQIVILLESQTCCDIQVGYRGRLESVSLAKNITGQFMTCETMLQRKKEIQSQPRFIVLLSLGNALMSHNLMEFSTYDNDNDLNVGNCAASYTGAWWYNNCYFSNLNGEYGKTYIWMPYLLTKSEMKIRPRDV